MAITAQQLSDLIRLLPSLAKPVQEAIKSLLGMSGFDAQKLLSVGAEIGDPLLAHLNNEINRVQPKVDEKAVKAVTAQVTDAVKAVTGTGKPPATPPVTPLAK